MDRPENIEELQSSQALALEIAAEQTAALFLLLQHGFFIEASVGCSIEEFFVEQLGLHPDYVRTRFQGIFLDGKPADDIDAAIIRDGSRLTVSGTMPGLVGIALRRGPLAVFRHSITHRETGDYPYSGRGVVQLKLLNLLLAEMGPEFLKKGLYLRASDLAAHLGNLPARFWQECKAVTLDGERVAAELFAENRWLPQSRLVKLSVTAG